MSDLVRQLLVRTLKCQLDDPDRALFKDAANRIESLEAALRETESEAAADSTRVEVLEAALEQTQIGVNHIATYRSDKWPEVGTDPMLALETLRAGREYDMWCCWNAAMKARDALEGDHE